MSKKISVIIPVYRTEKYLDRCIKSVQNQELKDIEIILVDDGSDDGSAEMCDRYRIEDKRIKVIHKTNGGLSSARNAGLEMAEGDYISFVDSDDYISSDMLLTLYSLITNYNCDISKVDYVSVSGDNFSSKSRNKKTVVYRGRQVMDAFLKLGVDSVCVCLYKRKLLSQLRFIEGKTSEDIPFNFSAFSSADSMAYLPEVKYFYYNNPDSISNGVLDKNKFNYLYFRKEIYQYFKKQNDIELTVKAESLYARAAMGLISRMALYGISPDLDEKKCYMELTNVFREHKKSFYRSTQVPLSRKVLGFGTEHFYFALKLIGRLIT